MSKFKCHLKIGQFMNHKCFDHLNIRDPKTGLLTLKIYLNFFGYEALLGTSEVQSIRVV